MSAKKQSIASAAARVQQEGIGYAVQHYMSGKDIADPELAKLWDEAAAALDRLEKFFARNLGKDWETNCYRVLDEE